MVYYVHLVFFGYRLNPRAATARLPRSSTLLRSALQPTICETAILKQKLLNRIPAKDFGIWGEGVLIVCWQLGFTTMRELVPRGQHTEHSI